LVFKPVFRGFYRISRLTEISEIAGISWILQYLKQNTYSLKTFLGKKAAKSHDMVHPSETLICLSNFSQQGESPPQKKNVAGASEEVPEHKYKRKCIAQHM